MSVTKAKHIHLYKAINKNKRVYRCTEPGCPTLLNATWAVGREARCPKCNEIFIITEANLRRETIAHIGNCTGEPEIEPSKELKDLMKMATNNIKEREKEIAKIDGPGTE